MKLIIENLQKTYPNGVKALDQVNLEIGSGMFGLLGPNGAGKSTFMRILATLQKPDAGKVLLGDTNLLEKPMAVKQRLGYLPQEFGVYPGVSAEVLLQHFAVLKGITGSKSRREAVAYLLQKVNLYEVRKRNVASYSGGMRQRFGIAQALLGNPLLVIVDEPTAGLDPNERIRFNRLLSEISEEVIVILSTHIVEDVSDLCQQMAIMNEGRIMLQGQPSRLLHQLEGKIWGRYNHRVNVADPPLPARVLYAYLSGGRPYVRVHAATCPGAGFEQVPANLKDLYFYQLSGTTVPK